jgi:YD repeat-containing protein
MRISATFITAAVMLAAAHIGQPAVAQSTPQVKIDPIIKYQNTLWWGTDLCNVPQPLRDTVEEAWEDAKACTAFEDANLRADPGWAKVNGKPYRYSWDRVYSSGTLAGVGYIDRSVSCPAGTYVQGLQIDPENAEMWCIPYPDVDICTAAGNPTLVANGRKTETMVDYAGAGAHPLRFERLYAAPMGNGTNGWENNFSRTLHIGAAYFDAIMADRPGAARIILQRDGTGTYVALPPYKDTATKLMGATGRIVGWQYRVWADDSTETYDAKGRLLSIAERNGWVTTLNYSTSATPLPDYLDGGALPIEGLLIGVRNHFGREIRLRYDAKARQTQLLPPGAVPGLGAGLAESPIRYAYDEAASLGASVPAQGQLTSVRWQDGALRRYHYEDTATSSALTGITDESGVRFATHGYWSGKVTSSQRAGGTDRVTFAYPSGNPYYNDRTIVTDYSGPNGSAVQRTYNFQLVGNTYMPTLVSAPCPLCGTTQKATLYDTQGNPSKTTAHDGTVTFYQYDARGRETERAAFPASYQSATTRPALSAATKVVSTEWHPAWNLPIQVAEPNKVTVSSYTDQGMLAALSWTATTDATGAAKFTAVKTGSTYATGWSYSASNLATTVVEKETPAGTTVAMETGRWTATYNAKGELTKSNNVTAGTSFAVTSFNEHGKPLTATDEGARALSFTYSPRGNTAKRIEPGRTYNYVRGPDNEVTRLEFDATNALTFERDASGTLKDIKLNGRTIVGNQLMAGAERLLEEREWWEKLLGVPKVLNAKALLELLIPSAHAQEVLLPACALGPNPVCITGVVATSCKVVIIAGAAAIIAVKRKRSCDNGGSCGDRDSPECKQEREHCTKICERAQYDPDMPNVWGGSFRTCYNGCVSSRCK